MRLLAAFALILSLAPVQAWAQAPQPRPTAPPGLGAGPQGPLQIDSDRLEVRDREKRAVFSGNVVAKRGEMVVRAATMTVFYDDGGSGQQRAPSTAGGQGQQVRRIEMAGPVFFCQRDQTARGDLAVYERASETLVMTGNVVLTQGENVFATPRLVVNMRSSTAEMTTDPARPGERPRSILSPNDGQRPQTRPNTPARGDSPC